MDGPIRRSILHRNTVECDQQGVRCCTNKYGKQMLLRVCTRSVSGSEVCVTGGFKTRSSARSQVGEFVCGDRYFGVRKAHTAYQDIDFTLRLTASGEVACWWITMLRSMACQ